MKKAMAFAFAVALFALPLVGEAKACKKACPPPCVPCAPACKPACVPACQPAGCGPCALCKNVVGAAGSIVFGTIGVVGNAIGSVFSCAAPCAPACPPPCPPPCNPCM